MDSLKKILETLGGKLVDEMENVKWVIRATPNKLTCIKPFILVYGYEAVAPIEIVMAWDREKNTSTQQSTMMNDDLNYT